MKSLKISEYFKKTIFIIFPFLTVLTLSLSAKVIASDESANSCSASDIQTAINNCLDNGGGTVTLPACDVVWNGSDSISADSPEELRILGQGESSTTITINTSSGTPFDFRGGGLKEFGKMKVIGAGGTGPISGFAFFDLTNARIHHLATGNWRNAIGRFCSPNNVVVDHCTFEPSYAGYDGSYGWYIYGPDTHDGYPASWTFGQTQDVIFFEDCIWKAENNIGSDYYHPVAGFTGSNFVIRNCTFNAKHTIDVHGPGWGGCSDDGLSGPQRGGRSIEVYNNVIESITAIGSYGLRPRSGSGIITGNSIKNFKYGIELVLEQHSNGPRCIQEYGWPLDLSYTGVCTGTTDGCCDKPTDWWIWGNTYIDIEQREFSVFDVSNGGLIEDREYFRREPGQQQDGFNWMPYEYPHPLVSASDQKDMNTLEVAVTGQGSVSRDPDTEHYATGTSVTLAAQPLAGWQFNRWSGNVSDTATSITVITLNTDELVTCTFVAHDPDSDGGSGGSGGCFLNTCFLDNNIGTGEVSCHRFLMGLAGW